MCILAGYLINKSGAFVDNLCHRLQLLSFENVVIAVYAACCDLLKSQYDPLITTHNDMKQLIRWQLPPVSPLGWR
jgi:hypothetical protein